MAEAAEEVAVSASGRAETEREHRASPAKDTLSGKVRDQYADSKATLLDIKESATEELQAGLEKAKEVASEAADKVVSVAQDTGRAASDATASFVSTLKQNPLATALLGLGGIGVAMLVSNSRSGAQAPTGTQRRTRAAASMTHNGRRSHARNGANGDQRLAADDESEGFVGQAVRQVRDGASAAASSAQKAVGSVGEQASALAQRAQTSLGEAGQAASQSVERMIDQASAQVQRLSQLIEENPLKAGAGAIAIGLGIGLLIPGTSRENQWLGAGRDQLVGKARELAHDALDKVEAAAKVVTGKADPAESET